MDPRNTERLVSSTIRISSWLGAYSSVAMPIFSGERRRRPGGLNPL